MKELFSAENIKRILKYLLYMFLTLVTQNMLFTQVRPLGVAPMVLPAAQTVWPRLNPPLTDAGEGEGEETPP